ncbi:hypothetical protein [Armatimonas sp.]|uniref:hypothetical protein n=1 Tax=Armatimonas sp. TaxID=1872638 RepID=UPI00286AB099|nr:hypothetical protein [Armatimonas sp.]
MMLPYLPAVLVLLLQPPQVVEQVCPPSIQGKISLCFRTARELDSIIGPILFPSRKEMVWPRRIAPAFGTEQSGMSGWRSEWAHHAPMRPPGIDNIVALENGTLLLQGNSADIDELTALVRALDVPIPSVECRLEVVRGKQKLLSASALGKVGTVVKANNALTGPATVAARVEATFKILPLGVGRYEIESQVKVSVPLAKRGMRLEKTFQSTREFTLGQTLTLDQVEIGGETVQLFLTLNRPR